MTCTAKWLNANHEVTDRITIPYSTQHLINYEVVLILFRFLHTSTDV